MYAAILKIQPYDIFYNVIFVSLKCFLDEKESKLSWAPALILKSRWSTAL